MGFTAMSALPLKGRRVAVTRSREQASELGERLRALGAEVLELPLITIAKAVEGQTVEDVFAEIGGYDWIVFTSANAFSIDGGPSQAYTSGGDIALNGWKVQISGTPVAGDTYTVQSNGGARGDNTNGLSLLALRGAQFLDGGTATYQQSFSQLLGTAGAQTQQATVNRDALKIQLEGAKAARDQVAGVNMDEEAADLLRFQQAYQGAAQVIAAADAAFKAILNAMQR